MKNARIWLLLLLAVLLPIRGAMAAAMLCPPAGVGSQAEVVSADHHALGHHGVVGDMGAHHHAQSDNGSHGNEDGAPLIAQDQCNLCSAFCSVTPLVDSSPAAFAVHQLASASFPALSAPAPTFLSDGQERPPRSI